MEAFFLTIDPEIGTKYSRKLATIMACEQLKKDLDSNSAGGSSFEGWIQTPERMEWTDSKIGRIELNYSLKAKGSLNNGEASIAQIDDVLQFIFSTRLGNISAGFQDILRHKSGYTNPVKVENMN